MRLRWGIGLASCLALASVASAQSYPNRPQTPRRQAAPPPNRLPYSLTVEDESPDEGADEVVHAAHQESAGRAMSLEPARPRHIPTARPAPVERRENRPVDPAIQQVVAKRRSGRVVREWTLPAPHESESIVYEGVPPVPAKGQPEVSSRPRVPAGDGPGDKDLEPVEVIDGMSETSDCQSCTHSGDSLCDGAFRSAGCDREKCPCPTDEVLSYYRCGFYGHYPTFWRPWPDGFMKYRPEVPRTLYDRFRRSSTADAGPLPSPLDPNTQPGVDPRLRQRTPLGQPRPQRPSAPEPLPDSYLPKTGPAPKAPSATPKVPPTSRTNPSRSRSKSEGILSRLSN